MCCILEPEPLYVKRILSSTGRLLSLFFPFGLGSGAKFPASKCIRAVLQATTFVVKNRACAEHVLEYLRRSQIGVATCLIVEEMPNSNTRYHHRPTQISMYPFIHREAFLLHHAKASHGQPD